MFPPQNNNNTTAEFALILMARPMKYLSGGTAHHEAVIPKTMKTKHPPPSLFQLRGPEERGFLVFTRDASLGSGAVGRICCGVTLVNRLLHEHGKGRGQWFMCLNEGIQKRMRKRDGLWATNQTNIQPYLTLILLLALIHLAQTFRYITAKECNFKMNK